MAATGKEQLLKSIPSISDLLAEETVVEWLRRHPRPLVAHCLREATDELRRQILEDDTGRCSAAHVTAEFVLERARSNLDDRTRPRLRKAINATGIILHTGLGRAAWPETVVDSMVEDLKGYVTLAVDRRTGKRQERDLHVEYVLTELTGAGAATVVTNNAAATLIVLAALCAGRQVIVSRGQLIEIGGSFRLPEVMAQSGARMVEVGTTNRTHLRDYERAVTTETAVIFRAHPSNYRIVGFTEEVPLEDLVKLAHARGLLMVDDLGAGALVGLERFGLPHEPTVGESIAAGADVVLFSADKLIGASQGGVLVGRTECIERIRRHPLARAFRVDKACLMALERTLHLFRDVDRLVRDHPTYRMLATPPDVLKARADRLAAAVAEAAPKARTRIAEGAGYLGSGSLPLHELPTFLVSLDVDGLPAEELARRLRLDEACLFARIERDQVLLDVRTLTDDQVPLVAAAVGRAAQ
jgi:L-seryl-tRNA(Ser) seleniumtransferase